MSRKAVHSCRWILPIAIAMAAMAAAPAHALNCGSLGQPTCVEAPPPGVELTLTPSENPFGLEPLSAIPAPDRPLWPRVNGHKPYGFNAVAAAYGLATEDEEAELHRFIGASLARVGADWAMIQYYPSPVPGGKPWNYEAYLDGKYRAYIRRGIRPLLMIARTPRRFTARAMTRANSRAMGCDTSDACWNPPTSTHEYRLGLFAADLVKRYPLAAGVEVWNEPNLSNPFWGGEDPDPARYASLLRVVHDAVKAVRPAMPVIGGSVSSSPTNTVDRYGYKTMSTRGFVRGMLQAGAQDRMDGLSYHPYLGVYPASPDPTVQSQELTNRLPWFPSILVAAYEDAGKPILERMVPTEFGVSTTDGWTAQKQSEWTVWQFARWDTDATAVPLSYRTDAAFAHAPVEDARQQAETVGYGFFKEKDSLNQLAPKLVACGFRNHFGGLTDCPAAVAGANTASGGTTSSSNTSSSTTLSTTTLSTTTLLSAPR